MIDKHVRTPCIPRIWPGSFGAVHRGHCPVPVRKVQHLSKDSHLRYMAQACQCLELCIRWVHIHHSTKVDVSLTVLFDLSICGQFFCAKNRKCATLYPFLSTDKQARSRNDDEQWKWLLGFVVLKTEELLPFPKRISHCSYAFDKHRVQVPFPFANSRTTPGCL